MVGRLEPQYLLVNVGKVPNQPLNAWLLQLFHHQFFLRFNSLIPMIIVPDICSQVQGKSLLAYSSFGHPSSIQITSKLVRLLMTSFCCHCILPHGVLPGHEPSL